MAGDRIDPDSYVPRTLKTDVAKRGKLPLLECLGIGTTLAEALKQLHGSGLIHRDIKPANVIFVNGRPKLADVGLVAKIRPRDSDGTQVGTPGYMPPPPEHPGTPQADIYALGMVLYVISTGRDPAYFPELSTSLVDRTDNKDFMQLNAVILRACHPDRAKRYVAAAEMHAALHEAQKVCEQNAMKDPG